MNQHYEDDRIQCQAMSDKTKRRCSLIGTHSDGGKVLCDGDAESVLNDPQAIQHYFGNRFDKQSIINGKEQMAIASGR